MNIRITDWAIVIRPADPYLAPELRRQCLNGCAENHPQHEPGKVITTSAIKGRRGGCVVTNSGSVYELGEVRAEYEAQYPGARERLFATLPEI